MIRQREQAAKLQRPFFGSNGPPKALEKACPALDVVVMFTDVPGTSRALKAEAGIGGESAVTQALGYTAEYQDKSAEDLENLFFNQSAKAGVKGLLVKAESLDDAKKRLADTSGRRSKLMKRRLSLSSVNNFPLRPLPFVIT
jgi:hypothetical protein